MRDGEVFKKGEKVVLRLYGSGVESKDFKFIGELRPGDTSYVLGRFDAKDAFLHHQQEIKGSIMNFKCCGNHDTVTHRMREVEGGRMLNKTHGRGDECQICDLIVAKYKGEVRALAQKHFDEIQALARQYGFEGGDNHDQGDLGDVYDDVDDLILHSLDPEVHGDRDAENGAAYLVGQPRPLEKDADDGRDTYRAVFHGGAGSGTWMKKQPGMPVKFDTEHPYIEGDIDREKPYAPVETLRVYNLRHGKMNAMMEMLARNIEEMAKDGSRVIVIDSLPAVAEDVARWRLPDTDVDDKVDALAYANGVFTPETFDEAVERFKNWLNEKTPPYNPLGTRFGLDMPGDKPSAPGPGGNPCGEVALEQAKECVLGHADHALAAAMLEAGEAAKHYKEITKADRGCECGAFKTSDGKAGKGDPSHASWCDWSPK